MDTIKALIRIDYKEHKRLLLVSFLIFHILTIFISIVSVFQTKACLYDRTSTTSYHRIDESLILVQDSFGVDFCMLVLLIFAILSFLLPLLFSVKSYTDGSIYLIDRLPKKRYHYFLSKYLPGLLLLTLSYVMCFLELHVYFGFYKLLLPTLSTKDVTYSTFMEVPVISNCFPVTSPLRFILILFVLLFLPALGLLLNELPRNMRRLHYELRHPYKKGH